MRKRAATEYEDFLCSQERSQSERDLPWEKQRVRWPFHAGVVYPRERQRLERWIGQVLALGASKKEAEASPIFSVERGHPNFPSQKKSKAPQSQGPRVLVAPHLDFRVEVEAYARAYRSLQGWQPERIILLGTGHQVVQGLFCLTDKDFATPLGISPCEHEALQALQTHAKPGIVAMHDHPHREEHALEFQLLFLQYLFGCNVPILPILCGSFAHVLPVRQIQRAAHVDGVSDFLEHLASYLTPKTLVVLGVDLSHIGWKFGHSATAKTLLLHAVEHERRLLQALCAGDAVAFWQEGQRVEDVYNVCGFSSMACLLEMMPSLQGRVLHHDIWMEWETSSAVGFASAELFSTKA